MPKLSVRRADDVPPPVHTNQAVLELQKLYEGFVAQATPGHVGVLTLDSGEAVRATKVRLRRAATRLGASLDIWDADGKVYFQTEVAKVRRPRRAKTA